MPSARVALRSCVLLAALVGAAAQLRAQSAALEYQVKAAYLFNFIKFVDWPASAASGPLTICVARPDPFGTALTDIVQGESIGGRATVVRSIGQPDPACHVVFVPRSTAAATYLAAARNVPVLTVGETPHFGEDGGIIDFVLDGGMVRFEINQDAAKLAGLTISSRLLRLARTPTHGEPSR